MIYCLKCILSGLPTLQEGRAAVDEQSVSTLAARLALTQGTLEKDWYRHRGAQTCGG